MSEITVGDVQRPAFRTKHGCIIGDVVGGCEVELGVIWRCESYALLEIWEDVGKSELLIADLVSPFLVCSFGASGIRQEITGGAM